MSSRALDALRAAGGVAGRQHLVLASSAGAVEWAVGSGQLARVLPRTLVDPQRAGEWLARARAAVAYAGPGSAISHLSALRVWDLSVPVVGGIDGIDGVDPRPVDVLVRHGRRPRADPERADVHVRRTRRPPAVRSRGGLPVVTPERAVVESWPLLTGDAQRAPAIVAVRRRLTTPERLRRQLDVHPRLRDRRRLVQLVDLLELGCHSELELWGHQVVFTGPRFAHLRRQVPLAVRGRTVRLDLYDDEAMLDIELDGRAYHDHPRDRERDIARDAAVAETGRLTLRFSHRRLTGDPEGCREQVWRVMQVRRAQLAAGRPSGDVQHR